MSNGQPQHPWKIEVNDRYQKVLGTVIALATAALVLPVLFLREFLAIPKDKGLVGFLDWPIYLSWALLTASVIAGVFFYYLSAKWIKSAWGQPVAISSGRLESSLDWSFWLSVATFILGIVSFLLFITSFRHVQSAKEHDTKSPGSITLDRGIPGLQLGMSREQAQKSFKLLEGADPAASLLAEYGDKSGAEETIALNKLVGKQFFNVAPANGPFPKGVETVDARAANNVLYEIGLHYGSDYVARVGWQGITFPYVGRYGNPTKDVGSTYSWEDERTKLEIDASGNIVNVFYTDLAIEYAVTDYEVKAKDLLRQQKQK